MLLLTVLVNLALVGPGRRERAGGHRTQERDRPGPARPVARSRSWGSTATRLLLFGLGGLRARPGLRPGDLRAAEEPAGARVDARDLRADLRDLQDLPDHAGQVHPASSSSSSARSWSSTSACCGTCRALQGRDDHPVFSLIGIARQLRRRLVRHPRQHVRQLAHRVRGARGQAVPLLRDPAQGRHEHRHAAHLRRAAADAVHPALHPARLRRPLLHRLRHRRVARRLGAAHRGRHLHQDRRHRLRPDEDRLQHQGRRRAQPGRDRRLHGRQRRRLGRPDRRRLRDLRRHRRRADLLHPAGGAATRRSRCSCSSGSSRCAS